MSKVHESHYDHKMDPKYRVAVPVAFRPEDGEEVRLQMSNEHKLPVVKVYPSEVFEDKFRQIAASDMTPARKNEIVGTLRMLSKPAAINPQGKLTVPKDWAEQCGLSADTEMKVAGRGPYFILCTKQTFAQIVEIERTLDDGGLGVL